MSEYCKTTAPKIFQELITNINSNYIVVSYNNTYKSKSSSSKNKITLDQFWHNGKKVGLKYLKKVTIISMQEKQILITIMNIYLLQKYEN